MDIRNKTIDLFLWKDSQTIQQKIEWSLGSINFLTETVELASEQISRWAGNSEADYVFLWSTKWQCPIPDAKIIQSLAKQEIDLAHAGLKTEMVSFFPDLSLINTDWNMINASGDIPSCNWRVSLDACLIRRELLLQLGGLDCAYTSRNAMGLDFGFRSMRSGALVEYRPEILCNYVPDETEKPSLTDFYIFLFRSYKSVWANYVLCRQVLSLKFLAAWKAWHKAKERCQQFPPKEFQVVWFESDDLSIPSINNTKVSVIIPTLGRYSYLKSSLDSLRCQTIKPAEVIVVDQNPPDQRQPELYENYDDLNIKVFWQDERGQSLARNTALAMVNCPYVFFYEDDAVAQDDLIEVHLRNLLTGRFHVSTGVSLPPPPSDYLLPFNFRFPRISQTFSTGNSMVPYSTICELGGFDRNYDFGPGTDADFGTRLYLSGYRILHDPRAIITHYKAPVGGLRTFRVHKTDTDLGLLQPFPPVTQSYYGLRYLSTRQQRERVLMLLFTNKFPLWLRQGKMDKTQIVRAFISFVVSLVLLPIKRLLSFQRARVLIEQGAQLATFK